MFLSMWANYHLLYLIKLEPYYELLLELLRFAYASRGSNGVRHAWRASHFRIRLSFSGCNCLLWEPPKNSQHQSNHQDPLAVLLPLVRFEYCAFIIATLLSLYSIASFAC